MGPTLMSHMATYKIGRDPYVDQSGFRSGEKYEGEAVAPQPGSLRRYVRLHRLDATGERRSLTVDANWVKAVPRSAAPEPDARVGALTANLPRDVVQKLWEIASDPPDECSEHLNDAHMLFQDHFPDFSILMDHRLELVARFTPVDGVAKEVRASSFGAAYAHAARVVVGL
jgi:hypothetical protein